MSNTVYIFIDEGGNTGFNGKKTKYFTFTAALTTNPINQMVIELEKKRYELISFFDSQHKDSGFHYFHANKDNKHIKNKIFEIISNHKEDIKYFSIIADKEKVFKALQDPPKFYYKILGFLIKYIVKYIKNQIKDCSNMVIICDELPGFTSNKKMESELTDIIKNNGLSGKLVHHKSISHSLLQVADYINYAVFQKWEQGNTENYDRISTMLIKEMECFK
ncbi:MAG: hypothetical protein QG673_1592 [Pseudomonadota bacterium]|nr:hypothetical protein [Pseudomonadota bacterium]